MSFPNAFEVFALTARSFLKTTCKLGMSVWLLLDDEPR